MIKQVFLFKRRPDLTMDQFIEYYEAHHAKLGEKLMPLARRYVRRYMRPQVNPMSGRTEEPPYDCIMETWWDSREDIEKTAKAFMEIPGAYQEVYEDEERLFATHNNPVFFVEEHDSELPRAVVRPENVAA